MHARASLPKRSHEPPSAIKLTPAPSARAAHVRAIRTCATTMCATLTHTSCIYDIPLSPMSRSSVQSSPRCYGPYMPHIYVKEPRHTPLHHNMNAPTLLAPHALRPASRILHPTPHIVRLTVYPTRPTRTVTRPPACTAPSPTDDPLPLLPCLTLPHLTSPRLT